MKKQFIILLTLLSTSLAVNAQKEYRLTKSSGQLKLNINGAIVEGYDGKEIIFSSQNTAKSEVDERAKGLVAISGSGYTDNTGMGISVTENGQEINVNTVSKKSIGIVTIKVPHGIKVSFNNNSNLYHEELILRNLKSEVEVSVAYNKIKLENNTGPMNVKTVYGSVDASFNNDVKGPISIISVYDYVDISLPSNTKANLELGTSYGKLYSAKEFAIDIDKVDPEKAKERSTTTRLTGAQASGFGLSTTTTVSGGDFPATVYSFSSSGERIKGKINGGGLDLIFKSTYKNVYLRQR
jgi:hypothetical protein